MKTGPHLLRGRNQSRKGAYDLVRNRSRKRELLLKRNCNHQPF